MLRILLVMNWVALVINNPYLISGLLIIVLLFISILLGGCRKFIGFVLFLVYIGGMIVLLSYCVILMPYNKFSFRTIILLIPFILISISKTNVVIRAIPFGLLFSHSAVYLISLLLYLVLLAVLTVIDYSSGRIKVYDEYRYLSYNLIVVVYCVHVDNNYKLQYY